MTARSIDGTAVARRVREDVARGVEKLVAAGGVAPGLATVLIGDDPASEVYVRNKRRLSVEAGMQDLHRHLPGDVDQATAAALIDELAADPAVSGILLQLPTPEAPGLRRADRPHPGGEGRRRADHGQRRAPRPGPAGAAAVHAGRRHDAARRVRRPAAGRGGGGGRPLRAGRQADGPAAAGPARDGDDLPLPHARPRRGLPAGRRAGRRRRHPAGSSAPTRSSPGRPSSTSASTAARTDCAGTSSSTRSPRWRARSPRCPAGSAR